jgi:hypothetical protein
MISIVYHCYLVGDWKRIVSEQLLRLKKSGLYDESESIYVTINLSEGTEEEFNTLTKDYLKLNKEFFTDNTAEYPAVKKVREIGLLKDTKIFYFHTKGVSNTYSKYITKDISKEKINNILAWKECLEYFLIDNWEESIKKLDEYDNVGVTCNGGWFWGNFWWTQTKHLKKTKEVSMGTRWAYEAWLNEGLDNVKNHEWYKFTFNPYLTNIEPSWYKNGAEYVGQKINLISANYGTPKFEIDEGYTNSVLDVTIDVTDVVKKLLLKENNLQFNFHVDNDTMGNDPIHMTRKFLMVEFSPENNSNKIFKMGTHEGMTFNFKF